MPPMKVDFCVLTISASSLLCMSWMWPLLAISSSVGIIDSGNVSFCAWVWQADPGGQLLLPAEKKGFLIYLYLFIFNLFTQY